VSRGFHNPTYKISFKGYYLIVIKTWDLSLPTFDLLFDLTFIKRYLHIRKSCPKRILDPNSKSYTFTLVVKILMKIGKNLVILSFCTLEQFMALTFTRKGFPKIFRDRNLFTT
jgi:hypothetical protein